MGSDSGSDSGLPIKREIHSPSPDSKGKRLKKKHKNRSLNDSTSTKDKSNVSLIREGGFNNQRSIEEYLANRTSLEVVDTEHKSAPITAEELLRDDEEEVWLVQCPSNVDIDQLVGMKLNLNGKRHKAKQEQVALEYESEIVNDKERFWTVMCKSKNSRPSHRMVSLKPTGMIRVRAKLTVIKT